MLWVKLEGLGLFIKSILFGASRFTRVIGARNEGIVVLPCVFDSCEFPHYTMCYSVYTCMIVYKSSGMLVRVPGIW